MNGVLVAMSGGVDSSAAAWLLKEQGYNSAGATMHLFHGEYAVAGAETGAYHINYEDLERLFLWIGIKARMTSRKK